MAVAISWGTRLIFSLCIVCPKQIQAGHKTVGGGGGRRDIDCFDGSIVIVDVLLSIIFSIRVFVCL